MVVNAATAIIVRSKGYSTPVFVEDLNAGKRLVSLADF
jgi:hypothetical protein